MSKINNVPTLMKSTLLLKNADRHLGLQQVLIVSLLEGVADLGCESGSLSF